MPPSGHRRPAVGRWPPTGHRIPAGHPTDGPMAAADDGPLATIGTSAGGPTMDHQCCAIWARA